MLTEWFVANVADTSGHHLTYVDFPQEFTWHADDKQWRRRRGGNSLGTIGRVYFVSPRAAEQYFLRVLLHHVPGARSWDDLKTVDGVLLPTFKEACVQRGLLQDDKEWK